jgi:hypothetical protein
MALAVLNLAAALWLTRRYVRWPSSVWIDFGWSFLTALNFGMAGLQFALAIRGIE